MPDAIPDLLMAFNTGASASIGIVLAIVISVVSVVSEKAHIAFPLTLTGRIIRAALTILFLLPPIVSGYICVVLNLEPAIPILLVIFTIGLILILVLESAIDDGQAWFSILGTGRPSRRFLLGSLRLVVPDFLLGLRSCIPWAVLAAMLGEMVSGQSPTLGIGLYGALQSVGLEGAWLICVLAVLLSALPYIIIEWIAYAVRRKWFLNDRSLASRWHPSATQDISFQLVIIGIVMLGVLWAILNYRSPILVPNISSIITRLSEPPVYHEVATSLFITIQVVVVALVAGTCLGYFLAILALGGAIVKKLVSIFLLPLQMLPLLVFVPALAMLQRVLEQNVLGNDYAGLSVNLFSVRNLAYQASAIIIGLLTCTYATYLVAEITLATLPRGLSPFIALRSTLHPRIVRHIYIPWLARSLLTAVQVALPRAFLAILISEVYVSNVGIGYLLSLYRSRGSYTEFWAAVTVLLTTVTALYGVSNAFARRR